MDFLIRMKGHEKLASRLKTSSRTIRDALSGKTASKFAKLICRIAIDNGADVYAKVPSDVYLKNMELDFETAFDHNAKLWTMTFSDRVQVVADMSTSKTVITVDGEVCSSYENTTIKQLPSIQAEAQQIADDLNFQ